jgi:hypothetical protein
MPRHATSSSSRHLESHLTTADRKARDCGCRDGGGAEQFHVDASSLPSPILQRSNATPYQLFRAFRFRFCSRLPYVK